MLTPILTNAGVSLAHVDFEAEIARLKRDMNAVILAHYYQESEIRGLCGRQPATVPAGCYHPG